MSAAAIDLLVAGPRVGRRGEAGQPLPTPPVEVGRVVLAWELSA